NPSFRPRFRFFHWTFALAGALGCLFAAVLIDVVAAAVSGLIIFVLWFYVRRRDLSMSFGDARRGYIFTRVRNGILRLQDMKTDAKNWRPTALVLTGNPNTRLLLANLALWLEAGRGMVTIAQILIGDIRQSAAKRQEALEGLTEFVNEKGIPAFVEAVMVPDFDDGLRILLQAQSLGPLKPNMVIFGWSSNADRAVPFADHLHCVSEMGMSMVVVADRGFTQEEHQRIDVWWRGRRNGSLMVLLTHLLKSNSAWADVTVRVLRSVPDEEQRAEAERELNTLVEAARIHAEVAVKVSKEPFGELLKRESVGASLVLLGFQPQGESDDEKRDFHARYSQMLEGLPTTLLVHSSGEADLLA
ncbi:MAG: hypothetical protein KC561_18475, partial [Myxococcales bacterium]|nr:hypothetical protein [Myxococcales bacterium]